MSQQPARTDTSVTTSPVVKISAPSAHWRRRIKTTPLPRDQAARQGDITQQAFRVLGKDKAIAFLNTPNDRLGGRPIALATESAAGIAAVRSELQQLGEAA